MLIEFAPFLNEVHFPRSWEELLGKVVVQTIAEMLSYARSKDH